MHGGASTGPRTQAGLQRLRDARTIHGFHVKHVPDAFDLHVTRLLERGRLMVRLSKTRLTWPILARELARLPPLPDPSNVPASVRASIQRLCDDLETSMRENAPGKTPCTESAGPRLRPEHFRLDPRVEAEHHVRHVLMGGKTPCTERNRRRPGVTMPPALHFAPWSIPPPGDPWGMTAWSDQVLGRGKAIRLPPEVGPPRSPAFTGAWNSPET